MKTGQFAWRGLVRLAPAIVAALMIAGSRVGPTVEIRAQQPVFRSGVNFVELDVSVLDGERRPVRGLTAADFTVLEDGVPQTIETFEAVVVPEPEPPPTAWWTAVPADVERNSVAGAGNLYLIVIRVGNAALRYRVKEIARQIVDRVGPGDRMAVVHTSFTGTSQEFTSDKALLYEAIDRYTGIAGGVTPDAAPPAPDSSSGTSEAQLAQVLATPGACGARPFLEMVRDLARLTASQTGRRKSAFVISDGWPPIDPAAACFTNYLELFAEAQRAHLNLYPINPRGLAGFGDVTTESASEMDASMQGLRGGVDAERAVAENTGGTAITQTNLFEDSVDRAFVENRAYYILGYQSTSPAADRELRKVSVRVAREGVTVRSRSAYATAPRVSPAAPSLPPVVAELNDATRAAVPATALPLDATAVPFRTARGTMLAVVASARPSVAGTAGPVKEDIQARVSLVDRFGEITETAERRAGATLARAEPATELRVPLLVPVERPGRYQVRVAANSVAAQATGSVFLSLDVPDFRRERLSLSGIAIGIARDAPSLPLADLMRVFPFMPSTRRTFRAADLVEAAVRVYASKPGASAIVVCRITNATGGAFVEERVADSRAMATAGGALIRCPIGVRSLGPGHYLMEIEARDGEARARRAVKFVIE